MTHAPKPMHVLASERGNLAFAHGWLEEAAEAFEAAVTAWERQCRPWTEEEASRSSSLYGNLGMAYYNQGKALEAVSAFLRALDGAPGSSSQYLRFLVTALVSCGRLQDASRYLADYEGCFGPHPEGWTQDRLEALAAAQREHRARYGVC